MRRSSSSSRSWLQSRAPASVCWRWGAARRRSGAERSSSRSRSARESSCTRAAASSMARGMPSSCWQISGPGTSAASGRDQRRGDDRRTGGRSIAGIEGRAPARPAHRATRNGSRLVARTGTWGDPPASAPRPAHVTIRCSQLSSTISRWSKRQRGDERVGSQVLAGALPWMPRVSAIEGASTRRGSDTGASSTQPSPSARGSRTPGPRRPRAPDGSCPLHRARTGSPAATTRAAPDRDLGALGRRGRGSSTPGGGGDR